MKVLIIQQKMIGDVLTSTIVCELLKKARPSYEIHYLINTHTNAVIEGNPHIDKVVFFKKEYRSSKLKFYSFLKEIKAERYDVVIDIYCKLESKLITLFSGAKTKISYKKSNSSFFYNTLVDYLPEDKKTVGLAIQNRISLLVPILKERPKPVAPKIYLNESEIQEAKELLQNANINKRLPIYMISVLGSEHSKTYPFNKMANILDMIIAQKPATLLFNYIPSQLKDVEKIYSFCNEQTKKHIPLDLYAPSLRSFIALLSQCDGLIGNEGGAVNMAKGVNVPTFAIFSPWITTEAWGLFENKQNYTVHLKDFKPELFEGRSRKEIRSKIDDYYEAFTPDLIEPQLIEFIQKL